MSLVSVDQAMTIDPEIDIVDSHHHLRENLARLAAGHRVRQSVYIECGWGTDPNAPVERRSVAEVHRVAELATTGDGSELLITGIVGHADLRLGARVAGTLDALADAGRGLLVGIRHSTIWDADPAAPTHRLHPGPGLLMSPTWREGFAQLVGRDLVFDAWAYYPQLGEVADLARQFPEVTIVLDHLGGPVRFGRYAGKFAEMSAASHRALAAVAPLSNLRLKLGAIGMPSLGSEWSLPDGRPSAVELADLWRDHIRGCIDIFGVDRCMFESNYPADAPTCSYHDLWNAFKLMVSDAGPAEKSALFAGTARATYGLAEDQAPGPDATDRDRAVPIDRATQQPRADHSPARNTAR